MQADGHLIEVLVDLLGLERLIERIGIGPAHHLMLQLRIGEAVEEFAKTIDLVAFGDDDVKRKTYSQSCIKLLDPLSHCICITRPVGIAPDKQVR